MALETTLRCGPSGWEYPHWDNLVYGSPERRREHPLAVLSRCVDAVEIQSSFRQPLREELTRLWVKRVEANPRFQFVALAPRQFTHERSLEPAALAAFHAGLRPIQAAGRLGAVVMQFPWAFRFTAENRQFLIHLRRALHRFPLVAEMRHASWRQEEAIGTFIDCRIGFANQDLLPYSSAMPPTALLTSGVGFLRLHGRQPARDWYSLYGEGPAVGHAYRYLYSEAELEAWNTRLERMQRFAEQTFVITSNDARAYSVVNALQLQARWGVRPDAIPTGLCRAFPNELAGLSGKRPMQRALFAEQPGPAAGGRAVA